MLQSEIETFHNMSRDFKNVRSITPLMVIIRAFLEIRVDFSRSTDPGQMVQVVSDGCNSVM